MLSGSGGTEGREPGAGLIDDIDWSVKTSGSRGLAGTDVDDENAWEADD